MNHFRLFALVAVSALPLAAKADTIINLNATVSNGTAIGGTPNTLANSFYQTLNLAPGTYSVRVVGPSTAGAVYSGWSQGYGSDGLAAPNSYQERTGFSLGGDTFSTANGNDTYTTGGNDQQIFKNGTGNCNVAGNCFNTAADALNAFANSPFTFTLASDTAVSFYIPDNSYPSYPGFTDNTGGVSLDLKAVTPEPSSLIMLGTGVLSAAGMIRRRIASTR